MSCIDVNEASLQSPFDILRCVLQTSTVSATEKIVGASAVNAVLTFSYKAVPVPKAIAGICVTVSVIY